MVMLLIVVMVHRDTFNILEINILWDYRALKYPKFIFKIFLPIA